jgi:hypothetical protein
MQLSFEEQLNELRRPCVINYFNEKNILHFLKTYINIDMLLNNYHLNDDINKENDISIFEKLLEINELTENVLVKELVSSIKKQINKKEIVLENIKPLVEQKLLHNLIDLFPIADIFNIDHKSKCQNVIQMKEDSKPFILIYSEKNSDTNISKQDVDLFYKDIKEKNSCGILCNSKCGISNRDQFEIDIQDSNVYIFISNHQYDNRLFNLAVKIIYNIYDIIKDNTGLEIDKELLQRLKLEYTYYMISHEKHINSMKSNLLALENLSLKSLDHFFKRTHLNSEDKPYSCQMCGTKFGTDKSLKSHLKIKHQIQLGKKRNKKDNDNENIDDDTNINENINEINENINEGHIENGMIIFD